MYVKNTRQDVLIENFVVKVTLHVRFVGPKTCTFNKCQQIRNISCMRICVILLHICYIA